MGHYFLYRLVLCQLLVPQLIFPSPLFSFHHLYSVPRMAAWDGEHGLRCGECLPGTLKSHIDVSPVITILILIAITILIIALVCCSHSHCHLSPPTSSPLRISLLTSFHLSSPPYLSSHLITPVLSPPITSPHLLPPDLSPPLTFSSHLSTYSPYRYVALRELLVAHLGYEILYSYASTSPPTDTNILSGTQGQDNSGVWFQMP